MFKERQKQIREHLAKSSGGEIDFQRFPQNYNPQNKSSVLSSNKKSVREHLQRSKGNFDLSSSNKQAQKKRILEHIRLTRG